MNLSIFSFGRREGSGMGGTATLKMVPEAMESGVVVAEAHGIPPRMILDLENLTPETLEAFFPSELSIVGVG
jgi:hypothetical protein